MGDLKIDISDLTPFVLKDLSQRELISRIQKISSMLTQNREVISTSDSYIFDEEMVSAYTLFYLPSNIPKLFFLFNKLPKDFLEKILAGRFIDYGSGPGTFALAVHLFARQNNWPVGSTFAVDHSSLMRKQAQKIFDGFNIKISVLDGKNLHNLPTQATLFFGHSLNEMEHSQIDKIITELNPQNIIFIEPGTKTFFQKLLKLRNYFHELGFNSIYPCAHLSKACPFETEDNWCHQIVRTTLPSELSRIADLCKLNRKQMPMIAHVYSKTDSLNNQKTLVRYKGESKFSWEWLSCQSEGEENIIKEFSFFKKNHKGHFKDEFTYKRIFDKLSVGDRPQIEKLNEKSDGKWDVKLIKLQI